MTLVDQVAQLQARAYSLEFLAGEMLATIKLNVERGHLVAVNNDGLPRLIASWEKQFAELTGGTADA